MSLVDYLKQKKMPSDFASRRALYSKMGGKDYYSGTAYQNTWLLTRLKATETVSTVSSPASSAVSVPADFDTPGQTQAQKAQTVKASFFTVPAFTGGILERLEALKTYWNTQTRDPAFEALSNSEKAKVQELFHAKASDILRQYFNTRKADLQALEAKAQSLLTAFEQTAKTQPLKALEAQKALSEIKLKHQALLTALNNAKAGLEKVQGGNLAGLGAVPLLAVVITAIIGLLGSAGAYWAGTYHGAKNTEVAIQEYKAMVASVEKSAGELKQTVKEKEVINEQQREPLKLKELKQIEY